MGLQKSDRNVTTFFCLLQTTYFCIVAVNIGFFFLMLSQRGYSEEMIGVVATCTSIASLVMPPVIGQWCDRWRLNRWMYVIAAVVAPVSYFCIEATDNFGMVAFWAVMFYGLVLAVQSVPAGWIAALNAGGRKINFSLTRAFGSLSFAVMSVVLGLLVEHYGMGILPYTLILFGILVASCALMLPAPQKQADKQKNSVGMIPTIRNLITNRPYMLMLLGVVLFGIPNGAYNTYFAVFFTQLGGSASMLGIANFVLAVVEVPIMILYVKLEKKVGVKPLVALSILGYGLKNLLLSMAPSVPMAIACLPLQMIGLGLSIPACQSLIASCTPSKYSGTAQSLFYSIQGVGTILANMLCTWLVTRMDLRGIFHLSFYFSLAGALIFLVGVVIPDARKKSAER